MMVLFLALLFSLLCSPLVLAQDDHGAMAARILIKNPNGPINETASCMCKQGELQAAIDTHLKNRMLRKKQGDRKLAECPWYASCQVWCNAGDHSLCAAYCDDCDLRRLDEAVPSQETEKAFRIVDEHARNLNENLHQRCQAMEQQLGDTVTAVVGNLSPACRCIVEEYIYLPNAVTFNCAVLVNDDELLGFKLWTAGAGGYTITDDSFGSLESAKVCANQGFNIEAVGGTSVKKVKFTITGPNGYDDYYHTENYAAFMAFGNDGDKMFEDNIDTAGFYTLTATPDNDASKELTLKFEVEVC